MKKQVILFLASIIMLSSHALLGQTVHTTVTLEDNQTVAGQKTFTPGVTLNGVLFANLNTVPSQTNGTIVWVLDGSATSPCTGGGAGVFAARIGGAWNCVAISLSGTSTTVNGQTCTLGASCTVVPLTLTTKGDLLGFSTVTARVPVGTDGLCLKADSTNALGVSYGACGAGGTVGSGVTNQVAVYNSTTS